MKKIKRIEWLSNGGKQKIKDSENFNERKIKRVFEDCIDYSLEKSQECEYEANEIIDSIKSCPNDRNAILKKLDSYIAKREEAEGFKRSHKYLKDALEYIEDIVEVDDEK